MDPLLFQPQSPGRSKCQRRGSKMTLHVQGQMIGARKCTRTELAAEGALSCVFSVVTGQLVGACKPPATAVPRAGVRLLPCWHQAPFHFPGTSRAVYAAGPASGVLTSCPSVLMPSQFLSFGTAPCVPGSLLYQGTLQLLFNPVVGLDP